MSRSIAFSIILTLISMHTASAQILDFEDITGFSDRENFVNLGLTTGYQDATWPSTSGSQHWGAVENSDGQFSSVGAFSGTQAVWNWSNGDIRNIIFDDPEFVNGAYFNVFTAEVDWGAATVQFNAYDAGDSFLGSSGTVNLDRDNANPEWQWLELNIDGVTRLEIVSTNDRFGGSGWWAMDDLTLNTQSIPEPSSAIAILGLGMVFMKRKRVRA